MATPKHVLKRLKQNYDQWTKEGRCAHCGKEVSEGERLCDHHREMSRRSALRHARKLREDAYAAYGGAKCACCGEDEEFFLTVDHIDGGGNKHRKELGPGNNIYRWLRDNGYPPGFQILCQNCNVGKWRNGGTCPHKSSDAKAP